MFKLMSAPCHIVDTALKAGFPVRKSGKFAHGEWLETG